jgi:SAM-dependent methyltransferase
VEPVSKEWDARADQWRAWARGPDLEVYRWYRDHFFDRIVPAPGRATLEIGCGEGRVARDLVARGHAVTAVDVSPALVAAAADADPASRYLTAAAEALPFEAGAFDLAVAYNSLMDVDDMPAAVREAARVLEPGGRLAVCVTHPLENAGRFAADEDGAPFVIEGSYLGTRRFEVVAERDGLSMEFGGRAYDLETYFSALEAAGFVVERLVEPAPSSPRETRWNRVPMFLMLRCRLPA